MYNPRQTIALTALAVGTLAVLIGGSFIQSSFAIPPVTPTSKTKAVQNGVACDTQNACNLLDDIDCVGSLTTSNYDEMICYLVPDGVATPDYKTGASDSGSSTTQITCPDNVGFESGDVCMSVTFPISDFTPGHWRFVTEFYLNGQLVNTNGQDFGVHSFFVIPESPLGIAALIGSSLAALAGYSYFRSKKGTQIAGL
jgi:hypothetical protein